MIGAVAVFAAACSTTSNTTAASTKKELSVQPHNIPASWEGSGGLGAMMGGQQQ